jgi:exosome complex component RRP4
MLSRKIVMPGDLLSTNPRTAGANTYVEGNKVYARVLGLLDKTETTVRVIPLKGRYIPSMGDTVVGIVKEVTANGWIVDILSPYTAFLPILENPEMRPNKKPNEVLDIGDAIIAKVMNIDPKMRVTLTMKDKLCRAIRVGRIVVINPTRVPRVIGKKGSMIKLLKSELDVQIIVGQNGLIWLNGDRRKVSIAEEAIYIIEQEAHTEGLTDRIAEFIKKRKVELGLAKPEEVKEEKAEVKEEKKEEKKEESTAEKSEEVVEAKEEVKEESSKVEEKAEVVSETEEITTEENKEETEQKEEGIESKEIVPEIPEERLKGE